MWQRLNCCFCEGTRKRKTKISTKTCHCLSLSKLMVRPKLERNLFAKWFHIVISWRHLCACLQILWPREFIKRIVSSLQPRFLNLYPIDPASRQIKSQLQRPEGPAAWTRSLVAHGFSKLLWFEFIWHNDVSTMSVFDPYTLWTLSAAALLSSLMTTSFVSTEFGRSTNSPVTWHDIICIYKMP